jgi:hypothetical protein
VALAGLAEFAPARAGPDDHVERQRAEGRAGVDALDHSELVGGVEQTYEFAAR